VPAHGVAQCDGLERRKRNHLECYRSHGTTKVAPCESDMGPGPQKKALPDPGLGFNADDGDLVRPRPLGERGAGPKQTRGSIQGIKHPLDAPP
jgi:hypothetical protein